MIRGFFLFLLTFEETNMAYGIAGICEHISPLLNARIDSAAATTPARSLLTRCGCRLSLRTGLLS